MTASNNTTLENTLSRIAREHLGIETLEPRGRDHLDFHDVGVISARRALEAAYREGQAELLAAAEALLTAKDHQMETAVEWRRLRRAVRNARRQNARPKP